MAHHIDATCHVVSCLLRAQRFDAELIPPGILKAYVPTFIHSFLLWRLRHYPAEFNVFSTKALK